ncbi:esterase-like activity of phytase family protein [Paenibacillus sp.]|uniref:esterase-like activity of phytase family protein n=1 Tax=Paenibacillus sp. TaxID=58172 RepID=UPI002D53415A|nr:esterase-like activity of phytase family protein [Paenibacillus sp.]HZG84304.1 esterase-like activity of phytase family protein [Paenibacillus sp.]
MKKRLISALSAIAAVATAVAGLGSAQAAERQIDSFRQIGTFVVPNGGVAEITAATPDGKILAYTNSGDKNVGIVDFADPKVPQLKTEIAMPGEPTSVAITGDGNYGIAVVNTSIKEEGDKPQLTPGKLVVINLKTNAVVGDVSIGAGPDAVAVTTIGKETYAVVAIENEPVVVDKDGNLTDAEEPGLEGDISGPGTVQIVALNWSDLSKSVVKTISFAAQQLADKGLLFPEDPQPEFVKIKNGLAAVTLQENNGVAVIDVKSAALKTLFSLGKPKGQKHDLTEDGAIRFAESYPEKFEAEVSYAGARMPDGIAWNARGTILYTADEGEMDLTGGRGWSAWTTQGSQVWKDNGELEPKAAEYGHYPEGRSEAGGIEVEGIETAVFGKKEFAFVGSEKGSFVAVYDLTNNRKPAFVQLLPTGMEPEGLLAIPQRNLFLTSDEDSGTITVFEGVAGAANSPDKPTLHASNVYWAAISGLASDAARNDVIYAVPDNALQSHIYRIDMKDGMGSISSLARITENGQPIDLDLEGIVRDTSVAAPANAGFWIASEGNAQFGKDSYSPNLLLQVDRSGNVLQKVSLPSEVDSYEGGVIRNNGFEGVAISSDGNYLLGAIQRQYSGEKAKDGTLYTRIARYDLTNRTWEFFLYPLEPTTVKDDWIGLSEIVNLGGDTYAVIERDKMVGGAIHLKALYTFTLDGVEPFEGLVAEDSDLSKSVVVKKKVADLREAFMPFEKIEGMTVTPDGTVWTALDNDGGEVHSVIYKAATAAELK